MAFTTTDARLILGYSSVAQLGFIVLGIFSLTPQGAQGAIAAVRQPRARRRARVLHRRAAGRRARAARRTSATWAASRFRAPVLATLFLIVALANLAMPGLVELRRRVPHPARRLPGQARHRVVAFTGVVLASVYALRLFIRAMHNRVGPDVGLARDVRRATGSCSSRSSPRSSRSPSTRSSRCTRASAASRAPCARPTPLSGRARAGVRRERARHDRP